LLEEFQDDDDTEVVAYVAAWKGYDETGTPFLTIELQPRWKGSKSATQQSKSTLDEFVD
jgi:hypothetical protein